MTIFLSISLHCSNIFIILSSLTLFISDDICFYNFHYIFINLSSVSFFASNDIFFTFFTMFIWNCHHFNIVSKYMPIMKTKSQIAQNIINDWYELSYYKIYYSSLIYFITIIIINKQDIHFYCFGFYKVTSEISF